MTSQRTAVTLYRMTSEKSPFVLGVLQQKGGVGKTTLALNLAHFFVREGNRVLLIDADPQGSAMAWSTIREEVPPFGVVQFPKPTLHRDIGELIRDYDVVVIDGAPRVNELARSAILASNFVLIPCQPSYLDYAAAQDTTQLIGEAQQFRPDIVAAFVVNRKIARTTISRAMIKAFRDNIIPVLSKSVTQRVAFAEAATSGLTIYEFEPSGAGARDITALGREIMKQWKETA